MIKMINKILKYIYNVILLINNKYKEIYKTKLKLVFQFLPANIYLFILFIALFIITVPKIANNYTSTYSVVTAAKVPGEIVEKGISQVINTSDNNRIDALGVTFSTYMRKNNSFYKILIYKNEKVIYEKKIDASKLKDNKEVVFKINKKVDKNDVFKFEVNPINVKEGNGITILQDMKGNYIYRVYKKSDFYNFVIIFSIIFLLLFFVFNYLINNEKIKNEMHFYKLSLIYILIALFIYPPLFVPDSSYHFNNAYTVSQSSVIDFVKSYDFKVKQKPSNIKCLEYGTVNKSYINVKDKNDIINCFNSKELKQMSYKSRINKKVAYIFSGLGIKIAMLFTNSPMIIYFIGALFSTLSAFFITLYALKIAPKHKRVLMLITMIPVFIQQMCSYSYDSLLNALCILIIAYLIKFFSDEEKIGLKDLIIYLVSIIVISIIKLPYILIGLPIIFVNKDKFNKKTKNKLLYLLLIITLLFIAYIMPKIGGSLTIADTSGTGKRGMSLSSLFDIKYTIKLAYHTIKSQGTVYLETFIGSLGWLNGADMAKIFIYSYITLLCLIVLAEKQYFNIKRKYKIIIVIANILLIGGIFLSMYLGWTTKGSLIVEGVQGRYFYAPILCLMLVLIPKKNKIELNDKTVYTFVNMSCLLYLVSILYLFY